MTPTALDEIANPQARLNELQTRLRKSPPEEVLPALLGRLDDPFPPIRHFAANALAERVDDRLAALAAAILHQPDAAVRQVVATLGIQVDIGTSLAWRQGACTILAAHVSEEARQALLLACNDGSADVRYEALVGLHDRGDVAPEDLKRAAGARLQDSDDEVATVAVQIIAQHGWTKFVDAIAAIRQRMHGPSRFQLTLGLAELIGLHDASVPPSTVDSVVQELTEALDDEETIAAAARGLVMLGSERGKAPLKGVLNRWIVHPLLRVEAAAALVELDDQEGLDYLQKALTHRRKDVRGSAIRVVGRLGLQEGFETLAELAMREDYHTETAILALVEWGDAGALEIAREVRDRHPSDQMRQLAARALRLREQRGRFTAEMLDFEEFFEPPRDGQV